MKIGTSHSFSSYIPIPPSVKKRLGEFAVGYTNEELKRALGHLSAIDKRIKSQNIIDETEITQFINDVIG